MCLICIFKKSQFVQRKAQNEHKRVLNVQGLRFIFEPICAFVFCPDAVLSSLAGAPYQMAWERPRQRGEKQTI